VSTLGTVTPSEGKIPGNENPLVAKSRGLNSSALAYAECAMLT